MTTRNKGIPAKKGKKGTPQPKRGPKKVAKTTAKKPAKRASKPKAKQRSVPQVQLDAATKVAGEALDDYIQRRVFAVPPTAKPKSWWRRALAKAKHALKCMWNG